MDGDMLPNDLTAISEELEEKGSDSRQLGIGEYAIDTSPTKIKFHGLGSCIAIMMYDPTSGVGGGIHTLLPRRSDYPRETNKELTRFTDYGAKVLYRRLSGRTDVNENALKAKIVGGSEVLRFVTFATDVGKKNIQSARTTLEMLGVDIVGEDVGGEYGRIVEFDLDTGGVIVRNANGDQHVI